MDAHDRGQSAGDVHNDGFRSLFSEKEMFNGDFHPDPDEDQSADYFYFFPEQVAEGVSNINSSERDAKRYQPDDEGWLDDGDLEERYGDSDRGGIDAGCEGEREQYVDVVRIGVFIFAFVKERRLIDHFGTDKEQEREDNPVVIVADKVRGKSADAPACQGHDGLKKAEHPRDPQCVAQVHFFDRNSACNGNGEGIHGKRDRDQHYGDERHWSPLKEKDLCPNEQLGTEVRHGCIAGTAHLLVFRRLAGSGISYRFFYCCDFCLQFAVVLQVAIYFFA
jgi:hypothetical protein